MHLDGDTLHFKCRKRAHLCTPFLLVFHVMTVSDGIFLLCRTSDELDINAFQFVAFESLPS